MKLFITLFCLLLLANLSQAQIGSEFETDSLSPNMFVASSFISDSEGWLADNAGKLWHTSNGGETWSSSLIEKNFMELDFADALKGFAFTAEGAFKTTDGGNTWSSLTLPGTATHSMYFLDGNTGFISGDREIYKTTDGGSNWTTISAGEGICLVDYYFINSSTGIAAAHDHQSNQTIWRTTNGGTTWTAVFNEEKYFINSVWFTDENTGWAAGYYHLTSGCKMPVINRTDDGGLTWENVYTDESPGDSRGEEFIDIRFRNNLEGFAIATYSQSVYTNDGGETWHFTRDEYSNEFIPDWGIYKALDGVNDMYLVGRKGHVTKWE